MTHNSDFAKEYCGLIGNLHTIGQAFHITSNESLTDFLASVSDYDLTGSLIGNKANSIMFDNSKLKRAVPDFIVTVCADQGIRSTIQHILSHPEL